MPLRTTVADMPEITIKARTKAMEIPAAEKAERTECKLRNDRHVHTGNNKNMRSARSAVGIGQRVAEVIAQPEKHRAEHGALRFGIGAQKLVAHLRATGAAVIGKRPFCGGRNRNRLVI